MIASAEADLLLHRFITERIPILAWFVSANGNVKVQLTGFVTSFSKQFGLVIATSLEPTGHLTAFMTLSHSHVVGSLSQYSDETELPKDFEYSSGLRLLVPNGDNLVIMEIRRRTE